MAMMQWCGAVARRVAMKQWPPRAQASPSGVMAEAAPTLCGRGDKKTKKGKIFKGSYGNARPKKEKKIERIKDKVEVPRCSCHMLYISSSSSRPPSPSALSQRKHETEEASSSLVNWDEMFCSYIVFAFTICCSLVFLTILQITNYAIMPFIE
ncbi:hypothetical protein V6N13_105998 [Hibiscus sabdariffa]|uniref:30S ribosomal protein S31, mitochondrial n=1 Tax=Hibiscus sabdariffa TaxID=183260 RepID=A0ABR2EZF2_9ROSI